MIVPIDIECIPEQPEAPVRQAIAETIQAPAQMKKPETIAAWHAGEGAYKGVKSSLIDEQYRKTALDGSRGQICSIAWQFGIAENEGFCIHAESFHYDEAGFLSEFWNRFLSGWAGSARPYWIGHHLNFDLPYLWQRSVILGVQPPVRFEPYGRHGRDFFDNMIAWAGYRGYIGQDALCKALGIEVDGPEVEGSMVWDLFREGEYHTIRDYNLADLRKVVAIYRRLHFLRPEDGGEGLPGHDDLADE